MTIKKLLEQADGRNIAEDLDEDQLRIIGTEVKRRFSEDEGSMTDWSNIIDSGMKLIKQDFNPKSEPFDGAANYKSPIIPEAVIKFGDRATLDLLNERDLVKGDVIGKDLKKEKQKRVDRVTEYMNFELNHKMTEWRPDQEVLFYRLPLIGNLFKKTMYDPFKGRNVSHLIHYPDFVVNQATVNIDEARSFTHILSFDRNKVFERQNSGLWLDVTIYPEVDSEENKGDEGSNESNDVDSAVDNEDRFLEQHCFEDLDEDGYAEPYIITIHESTEKVVRIVARYNPNTIRVDHNDRIESLTEAVNRQAKEDIKPVQEGVQSALKKNFEVDFSKIKLFSIEPDSQITSYPYYPSMDGTFLGFGLFHMIANLAIANNMSTNSLLDTAQLNNLGGGFLAKGFRKKMGPVRLKPAQWMQTSVSPKDLQQGMLPNPSKEASMSLMTLNDKLEAQLRNFTLVTGNDEAGIQANTAPTTALAMVMEAAIPTSALLLRITEAEGREFKKLFMLNQTYTDPEDYQLVLDDEQADFEQDFNSKMMDILPVANPEMSSKMQRSQMAEAQLAGFDRVVQAGGNALPIIEDYYALIGSDLTDRIFPEEGAMTEKEKKQMAAMTQATEQQNKMMEVQIQLLGQQVENEKIEAQSLAEKRKYEINQIVAKIQETRANTILLGEKAETEEVANQITKYTASMQAILDTVVSTQGPQQQQAQPQLDTTSALERQS
jgi:hypothetical protein